MKEYDRTRGEIVESHGFYYELCDREHENILFSTYIEAREYMHKNGSIHAFITRKEY